MPNIAHSAFIAGGLLLLLSGPAPAQVVAFPADNNGQITFVMPSHNVECTFTPAGGTPVYKPADSRPELSCDRREPRYVRIVLTQTSIKRFDDPGDQGCCSTANPFPYGTRWSRTPFTCESLESGLVCRNAAGRGFTVSRQKIELF